MMNYLLFGSQQAKQRRGNLWGRFVPWVLQRSLDGAGGGREVNYTAVCL